MISKKQHQERRSVAPTAEGGDNDKVDAGVEMSFPASDPPAVSGVTKLKKRPVTDDDCGRERHEKESRLKNGVEQ